MVQAIRMRWPRRTSTVGPGTVPLYPHIRVGGSWECIRTQVGRRAISISLRTSGSSGRSTSGTGSGSLNGVSSRLLPLSAAARARSMTSSVMPSAAVSPTRSATWLVTSLVNSAISVIRSPVCSITCKVHGTEEVPHHVRLV
ncbi:hypothetical protein SSCG_04791 [Streptomyces clavuligerus]|nr:hypothetical protein SSCG_04791 [Streptomyces clavuligerus]